LAEFWNRENRFDVESCKCCRTDVDEHFKFLIEDLRGIFPDHIQHSKMSRHKVRVGSEDYVNVKSHDSSVGTVDQDHDDSLAMASASISHSSIASDSDHHKEPGGEESHVRQCVDKIESQVKCKNIDESHVVVNRGIKGTYGKEHGHEQRDEGISDDREHGHVLSDTPFVGPLGNEATDLHPAVRSITITPQQVARNPVTVLEPEDPIPDVVLNAHEHDVDDVLTPNVPVLKPHDYDDGHDHDHDHDSLTRDPSPLSSCSRMFAPCGRSPFPRFPGNDNYPVSDF